VANYVVTLRKELLALSRACGVPHPSLVTPHQIEILDGRFGARTVADLLGGRGRRRLRRRPRYARTHSCA